LFRDDMTMLKIKVSKSFPLFLYWYLQYIQIKSIVNQEIYSGTIRKKANVLSHFWYHISKYIYQCLCWQKHLYVFLIKRFLYPVPKVSKMKCAMNLRRSILKINLTFWFPVIFLSVRAEKLPLEFLFINMIM